MVIDILGVNISQVTMTEAVEASMKFLKENSVHQVFTPNPEIIMAAQKDESLRQTLNEADLVVPDGIGVVIGSRILGKPLKERVAGYDLVQNIFSNCMKLPVNFYFFGAGPEVAEVAAANMRLKYPGLKIVGVHDGYFNSQQEAAIIEDINRLSTDVLLVGLGCPKQEKWISEHKEQLKVKIVIGVGGSFDVMSGKVKRAPKIFIKFGLEWFHRLITQPTRAKRMLQLPVFLLKVMQVKILKRR